MVGIACVEAKAMKQVAIKQEPSTMLFFLKNAKQQIQRRASPQPPVAEQAVAQHLFRCAADHPPARIGAKDRGQQRRMMQHAMRIARAKDEGDAAKLERAVRAMLHEGVRAARVGPMQDRVRHKLRRLAHQVNLLHSSI